jgi:hypothetical protein
MNSYCHIIGPAVMGALINCCHVADAQNDFTSTNGWGVDRYAPSSFAAVTFQGQSALQIGIDPAQNLANRPAAYQSTFYNTQGYQRPSVVATGIWTVTASLWVDPSTLSGTAPFRSDLWARTGPTTSEDDADYFIMGLFAGDLDNPTDPNPTAANFGVAWRVWDDVVGVWYNLNAPVTTGWNTVTISYDGNGVDYYLNGGLVFTDKNPGNPAYGNQLSTVFLEAYNFGNNAYVASWSGVTDSVAPASGSSLTVVPGCNQVTVQWPATVTNCVLETTTNLFAPNWTAVTNCTPTACMATMSNPPPVMFFRLH